MRPLRQRALTTVVALFALSLLEGATVLTRDLLPSVEIAALPPLEHAAITLGCFGLIALLIAVLRKAPRPTAAALRQAALTGIALFAAPACLTAIATRFLSPLTAAALETLAPLFCLILDPYLGPAALSAPEASQPRYGLLPALAAFSGVLLIFPVFVPSSYPVALAFAAALIAAFSLGAGNCLIVRQACESPSLAATAAAISLSAAVVLAMLSVVLERPRFHPDMLNLPTLSLFAVELAAVALLFWLTRRLTAPALATRVLWTLLISMLMEAAALPVPLSLRSWIGIALMALGAGLLLLPPRRSIDLLRLPLQ